MGKKILLKKLTIKNFKGIKNLSIKFSPITNIFGENGSGKTTVFDAFNFLLFDKDSEDRTKFDIQPLDKNNNKIHNLETEIEGILYVDNQDVTLRKIYKEKWVKPKGKLKEELRGYETLYYVDDVPKKQKEYKEYISSIVDEKIFKLVTNPLYFANLDWKKRRQILMDITGEIEDIEVINSDTKLKPIETYLNQDKTIDDAIKSIKGKIKRKKEDRDGIPPRVDELASSIEEYNFKELEENKKNIEQEIEFIDSQIADKSKNSEVLVNKKEEYFNLKNEYNEKLAAAREEQSKNNKSIKIHKKISELENNITVTKSQINNQEYKFKTLEKDIERNNENLEILRGEYKEIKNRKFEVDENEFICPTCKRRFEDVNIDEKKKEMENNFNTKKANDTKSNIKAGTQLNEENNKLIEETKKIKENIDIFNKIINDKQTEIELLKKELESEKENSKQELSFEGKEELIDKINALAQEINDFKQEDTSTLKENKRQLQDELHAINKQLALKEVNAKTKKRIEELEEKEKELSIQIAQLEQQEILCQEFIKSKVRLLEDKVNSMFEYVKFRFVKEYNTGGIEEDCEPIINGIPFGTNLNTAAKINAGVDIINTLSSHYGVQAPIFIDNRESVNDLIDSNSQIINLVVSQDKTLRVEQGE
ncbi:AAA family ATPase [Clostridium botulinum]|uniref:AAA family ATPase n=1 Tax=Clostridium botulinum TaxID=1491 RepID=UPI001E6001A8|nr:AAA family ATPase [Clostridium botulinum]MCD3223815.1 AAA family ATPase [Clostridium botulinum C/D]MCD3295285.1 AAA family ATPase [Clostridium botulinum C/D]